jgi:ElaB/YqjD/DUF883 family membrane-anchored ribosome-binding protein
MNASTEPQDNRDSREIQDDIRSTRGDMDRTLDRLNERLSPRALISDVMDWFDSRPPKEPGVLTEKSGDVLQLVKDNPIPALLTGVGIAWLITESKNAGAVRSERNRPNLRPYDDYSPSHPAGVSRVGQVANSEHDHSDESGTLDKAKGKLSEISGKIGDAVDNTKDAVSDLGSTISDRASQSTDSMKDTWSSARQTADEYSSDLGAGVRKNYRAVNQRFSQAVDEVPLGVGVGFLGLGVLAGLLLPRTETEDELMGDVADELKHEAADKGEELVERGKNVASRVADKAMEEAGNQGLTPDAASDAASTLSDKVGSVLKAATEEGKEAAEDEGLTPDQAAQEAEKEGDKLADQARARLND